MQLELIITFTVLALIAEVIGTISGFGSSVFFVPAAALFFDFHTVLGITALFHVFSNISKIVLFKNGIEWKVVIFLGFPAVVFVSIGALLSKFVNSNSLEFYLSIFLIAFSLLFIFVDKLGIKPTKINSVLGGSISGFSAGLIGTGGAIRGMTLSAFRMKKEVFIATSALIDFGVDLSRSLIYYSNGFVHKHDLKYILILVFVSVIGTYLGKKILNHISENQFKKIVLFTILGIGIFTFGKFIFT